MRHAVGNGGGKVGGMCASAINLPAASTMETPQLRPKLASMTAKPANNTLPSPTRNHEDDDNEHQVRFYLSSALLDLLTFKRSRDGVFMQSYPICMWQ